LISPAVIAENQWDMSISRYVGRGSESALSVNHALEDYTAAREDLSAAQADLDALLEGAGYIG